MATRPKNSTVKNQWIRMPQTRTGRMVVAGLALCCLLGSAYALSAAATRPDREAEGFVNKYQYVDQFKYRAKR